MAVMKTRMPFTVFTVDELDKIGSNFEAIRMAMLNGFHVNCVGQIQKIEHRDNLLEILDQKYIVNGEVLTLLIESALHNKFHVMNMLLVSYRVNVDATGNVQQFGMLVEGASALWCAAARGHVQSIEILISEGATVDLCTTTQSTPLRAACYSGNVEAVKYLVEHGANINKTNIYNSTCLMIASYYGYVDIVNYLISKGANIDAQTNCGATAMHFAAQANTFDVIELLVTKGAKQLKNNQFMTPILVAAERTNYVVVNYLLDKLNLTRQEQIDVYELIGASFLNDRDNYNYGLGFNSLMKAMKMRSRRRATRKQPYPYQVVAEYYNNQIECKTVEELMNLKDNHEALHFESLIIRERILGENNPDLLQSIIFRGACYADSHNFEPCLKLWYHATEISLNNHFSVSGDLLRFAQVFCQMIKTRTNIELSDLKKVLSIAIEELKSNQKNISENIGDKNEAETKLFENMLSTLGLIIITSTSLKKKCNLNHPLIKDVMQIIVELNKMEIRSKEKQTLLHLCLNYRTNVDNIFTTGICCFPNYLSMKLLIFCGADVNTVDIYRNTPLHYIGKFIKDFPHIPHDSDQVDTKKMVIELLNAGAHTDFVNKFGECPYVGYLKSNDLFKFVNNSPRSLKCLAACVLKYNFTKEQYCNELPKTLVEFTDLH